jgi:TPR repeat protein
MYHLGIACYEGNGVRQSNSLALKWLIEATRMMISPLRAPL